MPLITGIANGLQRLAAARTAFAREACACLRRHRKPLGCESLPSRHTLHIFSAAMHHRLWIGPSVPGPRRPREPTLSNRPPASDGRGAPLDTTGCLLARPTIAILTHTVKEAIPAAPAPPPDVRRMCRRLSRDPGD